MSPGAVRSVVALIYAPLLLALSMNVALGEINIETLRAELNKNPRRCTNETVKLLSSSCKDAGSGIRQLSSVKWSNSARTT